ncbi:MAG TPA: hypothetical protein VNF47_20975 [Streptosporangiaceae bacterium]|nr:hypothetical protein [Streptosporangiaceae bacterium]
MAVTAACGLSVSRRLDCEPAQVRHARERVRKTLAGWGLIEHTYLAELVTSELVLQG